MEWATDGYGCTRIGIGPDSAPVARHYTIRLNAHSPFFRSASVAFLSIALAFSWQWVVVHTAFQGNWTALFCAGDYFSRPPEMQHSEYVFKGSTGFDGQFYQLIAHDPLLRRH
jgi:hypothetical protein